ncbi:MAG: choice-of-anchor Q domain-containing protein [Pirellulales bacterium]
MTNPVVVNRHEYQPLRRHKSARKWATSFRRPLRFEPLEDRRLLSITVDTLVDENNGIGVGGISLREAISAATTGETIDFAIEGNIMLQHGQLLVNKDLTIEGPGANLLTIDARGASRVFSVDNGNAGTLINVAMSGLTITGGDVTDDGGGILNRETLTVTACHITSNSAEDGGGIGNFAGGTFSLIDSTVSHNSAFGTSGGGGGIFNFSTSKAQTSTITNSTISNNTTTNIGGGIYNFLGTILVNLSTITENDAPGGWGSGIASLGDTNFVSTQVGNTIIAGNLNTDVDIVVGGQQSAFMSTGFNLIGDGNASGQFTNMTDDQSGVANPLLGPLADNSGPTPTHLPLANSPAIDMGNPALVPPGGFDQRGAPYVRVFDGDGDSTAYVDVGAVERDIVLFEVDTLEDEDDLDFSAGDFSLREAIGQASLVTEGTPTIVFAPALTEGGPATISLVLGQLEIGRRMVVEGPGAELLTIDAQQNSRVFSVNDYDIDNQVEVTISGLTLTGGRDEGGGGGIHTNERLTVADSVVTGNVAEWGGGIYNAEQGVLRVVRSHITGNAADVLEDGFGEGGGFYNWGGSAKFVETTISGNTAPRGGGVSNANFGDTTVESSTISGNIVGFVGGGAITDSGALTIRSSTISGNQAGIGGGVYVFTAFFLTTTISNSTISGNVASSGGGGVYVTEGHTFVGFCTITENVSDDELGSGIATSGLPNANIELYSSIVAANFDPGGSGQENRYDIFSGNNSNTLTSLGYNIVGLVDDPDPFQQLGDQIIGDDDPLLGPLADNGGPTQSHALLAGSPAIDAGYPLAEAGIDAGFPLEESDIDSVPEFDQRGPAFSRVRNGDAAAGAVIDIGACEAQVVLGPALPGDYNLNNTVDAADFVLWRKTLGTTGVSAYSGADGDGDGEIGQGDYAVWRAHFGQTLGAASTEQGAGSVALAEPAAPEAGSADGGVDFGKISRGGSEKKSRVESQESSAEVMVDLKSAGASPHPLDNSRPLPEGEVVFVRESRPRIRAGISSLVAATRNDIALLACLALRGESDREADSSTLRRLSDDRFEPQGNDRLDATMIDAAIVEFGARL